MADTVRQLFGDDTCARYVLEGDRADAPGARWFELRVLAGARRQRLEQMAGRSAAAGGMHDQADLRALLRIALVGWHGTGIGFALDRLSTANAELPPDRGTALLIDFPPQFVCLEVLQPAVALELGRAFLELHGVAAAPVLSRLSNP